MNKNDLNVIAAMGDKFAQLQVLAKMVAEQPATRAYAESQMARILESMTPEERVRLRESLRAAGYRK